MAMPASPPPSTVVPAQLGFLTIFNPSLGLTDDTIDDQIVYYASVSTQSKRRRHRSRGKPTDHISQDEKNEQLRQIGLAQGMVEFSRGFSDGKAVDTIETEKSRVVLHELEPGWWILASIDLTKIPLPPRLGAPPSKDEQSENVEYSSREMKPAVLLMQDLLRAHSIFLLHHSASLSALFVKSKRQRFISILSRYWDLYSSTWDVMLHGNPASNVFGGIKIAACGELGVGVGEEDRGSGEREVLEGFVDRVEGLSDLIVSKFGESGPDSGADPAKDKNPDENDPKWLGTGEEPGAEDGVIFLGVGALSKRSLRDVTYWMEDLYTWGENAYGVKDSPTSTRQARKHTKSTTDIKDKSTLSKQPVNPAEPTSTNQSNSQEESPAQAEPKAVAPDQTIPDQVGDVVDEGGMNRFMNYFKMGYGTHWTLGGSGGADNVGDTERRDSRVSGSRRASKTPRHDSGHYLIGLLGDVEEIGAGSEQEESREQSDCASDDTEYNSRVLLRTLTVELEHGNRPEAEFTQDLGSQQKELTTTKSGHRDSMDPNSRFDSQDRNKTTKMRVVVYVNKPFIYTFIFQNRTDSLAWDSLYKSLHNQLAPLRKPLTASTAYRPGKRDTSTISSHIFDLVWDPKAMTIHSTIPNIPTPLEMLKENPRPVWSRAEAINTHNQILNTYIATLTDYTNLERTCKTSRGWWIVWTRIMERAPPVSSRGHSGSDDSNSASEHLSDMVDGQGTIPNLQASISAGSMNSSNGPDQQAGQSPPKPKVGNEIFLIRRAGEHLRGISSSYAEGAGWADGASRLAQGIGVDTHKYIEGLLSLGR